MVVDTQKIGYCLIKFSRNLCDKMNFGVVDVLKNCQFIINNLITIFEAYKPEF